MGLSIFEGFSKSLAMTVLSEVGDKTFFAAAGFYIFLSPPQNIPSSFNHSTPHSDFKILAMRHPRRLVLAGCLGALIVMTALSVLLGWATPNLISRKWTRYVTTILFFVFGFWSLWEAFTEEGETEDLAEMEAKLDEDWKGDTSKVKTKLKGEDDLKKHKRPFLTQFFSPIFLKAFSITFFGEWGDKSQIATIGLAADVNPVGVILGGIIGQALCTTAAVLGGKSLASQISEKMVGVSSGILFIIFGIQSLLTPLQ